MLASYPRERVRSNRVHNTSSRFITVRYRFHPLAGRSYLCDRTQDKPPRTHLIRIGNDRLPVPVWMTEEWSEQVELLPAPQIAVEHLFGLANQTRRILAELTSKRCILTGHASTRKERKNGRSGFSCYFPQELSETSQSTPKSKKKS